MRTERGLTQTGLAHKARISQVYLSKLEAGTRLPGYHILRRLGLTLTPSLLLDLMEL